MDQFSRTEILIGKEGIEKLHNAKVAIFGVGGVGGYVCEALVRSGVGEFMICDNDVVSLTNINRQIIATLDTIGEYKTDVMERRMKSINKDVVVDNRKCFFLPENESEFDFKKYDYIVDCVDTVTAKISIIIKAKNDGVDVISAMGAGNKLNPWMLEVADIYDTQMDPLSKVMRYELKKRGVKDLKVVYSKEKPITPIETDKDKDPNEVSINKPKKQTPGSTSFVPSTMGLIMASEIVKDILKKE